MDRLREDAASESGKLREKHLEIKAAYDPKEHEIKYGSEGPAISSEVNRQSEQYLWGTILRLSVVERHGTLPHDVLRV